MAIITKPAVSKNSAATFTLNKTELALVNSVSSNAFFSIITNWKYVRLFYQSSPGNQTEIVVFDATQATPQGQFLVSDKARDQFNIQKITIEDFDGGFLEVKRVELNTVDFDITFTAPVTPIITSVTHSPSGSYIVGNSLSFVVNFDSPIQKPVTGSPRLALTVGSSTKYATLITTPATTSVEFTYIIQSGDVDNDGIIVEGLDLNGGAIQSPSGVNANLTFTPFNTGITIGAPSTGFTVGEIPGFESVEEIYNFEELIGGVYYPDLIVRGVHDSSPNVIKMYKINNSLVRTLAFEIPGGDNTQTATTAWNRATSYRDQVTGHPILIFRGRPNTSSANRKVYKWNSFTGTVTKLDDTNPSGEDLPEAFFTTTWTNPSNPADVRIVILYAAIDDNGYRKLFKYDTVAGTVSKIQDYHSNADDIPSDFISFTHSNNETYTYFFINREANPFWKGEKILCRMDKFGSISYLPNLTFLDPSGSYGNLNIYPTSYTKGFGSGNLEPYVPDSSFSTSRPISSMTIWGTKLAYFAYYLGASSGYQCLAMVNEDGTQTMIESTVPDLSESNYPSLKTVVDDRYYNTFEGNFYFTVDDNPNFTQPTSFRIGYITPTLEFGYSTSAEVGASPIKKGTSVGILYTTGFNTNLNRNALMLYPELSVVGPEWTIPNANAGEVLTEWGILPSTLVMVEFEGYLYFPGDEVISGTVSPDGGIISKLRRVPLTTQEPIDSELVYNLNDQNAQDLLGELRRISDSPGLLTVGLNKVFFTAFSTTTFHRRLFYVTHT